jgi:hypothetical protein
MQFSHYCIISKATYCSESLFLHNKNYFFNMKYPDPVNPRILDLVMRDHDHAIYYADKVLLSPKDNEIASPDIRFLKHLLVKITIYGKIDPYSVNSFALFCFQRDFLDNGNDPMEKIFLKTLTDDPLVLLKTGKGNSLIDAEMALTYFEDHPAILNLLFWGMPEVGRRLTAFLDEISEGQAGDIPDIAITKKVTESAYHDLPAASKSAINLLTCLHRAGILLPMMLTMGKLTPSEYATAVLAINLNYTITKTQQQPCGIFDGKAAYPEIDRNHPEQSFQVFHLQAIRTLEYLSFFLGGRQEQEPGIRDLIAAGESYNVEFKTSFRWDVRQEKKNPAIEHASLKTITAFLNSSGGHLLIGVEDDGRVEGVEIDKFENDDKFLLHFWNLIKSSMGQEVTPYIRTSLEKIGGGTVCHVKCTRSPSPVFLNQKGFGEEFYIRTGPSSASLEIREALKYIAERFPSG